MTTDEIHATLKRTEALAARNQAMKKQKLAESVETAAGVVACKRHPTCLRPVDHERTRREFSWRGAHVWYAPCPECATDAEAERLCKAGAPASLCRESFDTWHPETEADERNLHEIVKFAASTRRGFVVLTGPFGTGKTHLAVGSMRHWPSCRFITQAELLRWLRRTYRDRDELDPVTVCQRVGLLVLDDCGISAGGRDEFPLIHDVLAHRHAEQAATILTTNLDIHELSEVLGPRLADRLRESLFAVLTFEGRSKRWQKRQRYFDQAA